MCKGRIQSLACGTSSIGAGFGSRTAAVELPGDLLTPFGVFCLLDQQQSPGGDAFLFEGALGRYSYVGTGQSRLTLQREEQPLERLRAALEKERCERDPALPPFCGGYVGFLAWAAAGWTERLPQRLGPDPFFPEADLRIVADAGHSAFEPGNLHELIEATDRFAPGLTAKSMGGRRLPAGQGRS